MLYIDDTYFTLCPAWFLAKHLIDSKASTGVANSGKVQILNTFF